MAFILLVLNNENKNYRLEHEAVGAAAAGGALHSGLTDGTGPSKCRV